MGEEKCNPPSLKHARRVKKKIHSDLQARITVQRDHEVSRQKNIAAQGSVQPAYSAGRQIALNPEPIESHFCTLSSDQTCHSDRRSEQDVGQVLCSGRERTKTKPESVDDKVGGPKSGAARNASAVGLGGREKEKERGERREARVRP